MGLLLFQLLLPFSLGVDPLPGGDELGPRALGHEGLGRPVAVSAANRLDAEHPLKQVLSKELLELVAERAEHSLLVLRPVILGSKHLLDVRIGVLHEVQLVLLIVQTLTHRILVVVLLIVLPREFLQVLVVFVSRVSDFEYQVLEGVDIAAVDAGFLDLELTLDQLELLMVFVLLGHEQLPDVGDAPVAARLGDVLHELSECSGGFLVSNVADVIDVAILILDALAALLFHADGGLAWVASLLVLLGLFHAGETH